MIEYIDYKGLLLNQYEWSGGFGKDHKEVIKEQSSRRREVTKGFAKIIKGD